MAHLIIVNMAALVLKDARARPRLTVIPTSGGTSSRLGSLLIISFLLNQDCGGRTEVNVLNFSAQNSPVS